MDTQRYLKNVTILQLDQGKCNGCRMCLTVCPHGVFEVKNRRAIIVNKDSCMECGACQLNCPQEAIKVKQGVGCAAAIIWGALTGRKPACG